jgi:hypothetical protein
MMNKPVVPQMSTEVTTEPSKTTDITLSEAAVETSNTKATAEASKTKSVTPPEISAGGSTNATTTIDLTDLVESPSSSSDDAAELYSRD